MRRSLTTFKRAALALPVALLSLTITTHGAARAAQSPAAVAAQYGATVATNSPTIFAFPTPPTGFDPTRADTAELQRYGLPLPPDASRDPADYQHWKDLMGHTSHRIVPHFGLSTGRFHSVISNIWSGTVLTFPNVTFNEATGDWTIPSVTAPTTAIGSSSSWVGLDGYNNQTVEQLGTEQDVCSFCSPIATYYPWIETYPDPEQPITNFPVGPGDKMTADVRLLAPAIVYFTMTDLSNGYSSAYIKFTNNPAAGQSAEWIEERPTTVSSSGTFVGPLANFHSVTFSNSKAYSPTYKLWVPGAVSHFLAATQVNMVNTYTGHTLATAAQGATPYDEQITWVTGL